MVNSDLSATPPNKKALASESIEEHVDQDVVAVESRKPVVPMPQDGFVQTLRRVRIDERILRFVRLRVAAVRSHELKIDAIAAMRG